MENFRSQADLLDKLIKQAEFIVDEQQHQDDPNGRVASDRFDFDRSVD